ncbi:putative diguanylate cyclase YedQ [compost metagenome]
MHFVVKFSGMDRKMPRYLYPWIFYLPVLVIGFNLLSQEEIISSSEFIQEGIWKNPIFNAPYYIALTTSIMFSLSYIFILYIGKKNAVVREHKQIYNLLMFGVALTLAWISVFGYFRWDDWFPPYSYIYGGLIFISVLRLAMVRYDFLSFESKRYEKLFNISPAAILMIELSGKIKEANPSAIHLFHSSRLRQISFYTLVDSELENKIRNSQVIKDYETTICIGDKVLDTLIDGDYVTVDNVAHIILIVRDITVEKVSQKEIKFLAYHDPLTELPNRRFFYEKLEDSILDAAERKQRLAILLIDLDNFKYTNDQFGHQAGDEVLKHVAGLIQRTAEPIGMAARLGGDEFVMFICDEQSIASIDELVAGLRYSLIKEELYYTGSKLSVSMSIGISFFPEDGRDADTLMNNADKDMYQIKEISKRA